jgi:hypothetical protein
VFIFLIAIVRRTMIARRRAGAYAA